MAGLFVFWKEPTGICCATGLLRQQTHLNKHNNQRYIRYVAVGTWFAQHFPSLTYSLLPICVCRGLLKKPDPLRDSRQWKVLRTHCPVSYLYARLPFLCVIRDVKQVPEALVGDKLVVRRDNARVSPGCRVSLFLFSFQPSLLFQDFLRSKTRLYSSLWHFHTSVHVTHSLMHTFFRADVVGPDFWIFIFSPPCLRDAYAALHLGSPHVPGMSLEWTDRRAYCKLFRCGPRQIEMLLHHEWWDQCLKF